MTLLLNETNHQTAEVFAEALLSSPNPKQTLVRLIHDFIDHPWMDEQLRDHLVLNAANNLGIEVIGDEEGE